MHVQDSVKRRRVIFVTCKSIPKDGLLEVQYLTHTGKASIIDEDSGEMEEVTVTEGLDDGVFSNPSDNWRTCSGSLKGLFREVPLLLDGRRF